MKKEDFERAQDLLANIRESEKEVKRLMSINDKRLTCCNKEFVCYTLEHYQSPGLMEKIADIIFESISNQIHAEQDNIAHLTNLFDSL